MPVFKDDERAAEILSGKIRSQDMTPAAPNSKRIWLFILAATAFAVGGVALFSHRGGARPASAALAVAKPVPAGAETAKPAGAPAISETSVQKPALPSGEIVNLPASEPSEKKPAISEATPAKPANSPEKAMSSSNTELGTSVLRARALMKVGKNSEALELLHARMLANPSASAEDKAAAAITEGRALLAEGKIADAKVKFEPLAFLPASTETGADALLGNLWCQAGALSRCRDSELEQVRGGPDSWANATASLEEARRAEEKAGATLEGLERARVLYQQAFDSGKLDGDEMTQCVAHLTALANKLLLDPKAACVSPKPVFHKVETGDNVEKIARKYKVNVGQIKRINRLNDKLVVRLGQNLKLLPGEVVYKVDRTRLTGTLYVDGIFLRQYPVGIGPGNATPTGSYSVENKLVNPDWWYDGKKVPFGDPANILGTRWMGFAASESGQGAGLGVHGTAFPDSVPGRESKGCVRMHNADVEELYDFMPQGGKVVIQD
jgi:lipoprotein-anchoring transpeptidase ErfK/SrfK